MRRLLICLTLVAGPAAAHHNAAEVCDTSKIVTLKGEITKVQWNNPHVIVWLNVKNHDGSAANWLVSLSSSGAIAHQGVTKESFKIGSDITVSSWL